MGLVMNLVVFWQKEQPDNLPKKYLSATTTHVPPVITLPEPLFMLDKGFTTVNIELNLRPALYLLIFLRKTVPFVLEQ